MSELKKLEQELYLLTQKVHKLRMESTPKEVPNYTFATLSGQAKFLDLFGDKETLLVIHNMGQACRYCTLWGDEINALLPHLESRLSVALVSKDPPQVQRRFANDRGWRFQTYSHKGSHYIKEQTVMDDAENMPGVVCYTKSEGKIWRKNSAVFGPGDEFCGLWNLVSLTGMPIDDFTPQYHYWKRPEVLEDGGNDLN